MKITSMPLKNSSHMIDHPSLALHKWLALKPKLALGKASHLSNKIVTSLLKIIILVKARRRRRQ